MHVFSVVPIVGYDTQRYRSEKDFSPLHVLRFPSNFGGSLPSKNSGKQLIIELS